MCLPLPYQGVQYRGGGEFVHPHTKKYRNNLVSQWTMAACLVSIRAFCLTTKNPKKMREKRVLKPRNLERTKRPRSTARYGTDRPLARALLACRDDNQVLLCTLCTFERSCRARAPDETRPEKHRTISVACMYMCWRSLAPAPHRA